MSFSYNEVTTSWSVRMKETNGSPIVLLIESDGQYCTDEETGFAEFIFYKRQKVKNGTSIACQFSNKGCPVRALVNDDNQFVSYMKSKTSLEPVTVHNHLPPVKLRVQRREKALASNGCVVEVFGRHFGHRSFLCPKGYLFTTKANYETRDNGQVNRRLACENKKCLARILTSDHTIVKYVDAHNHPKPEESELRNRRTKHEVLEKFTETRQNGSLEISKDIIEKTLRTSDFDAVSNSQYVSLRRSAQYLDQATDLPKPKGFIDLIYALKLRRAARFNQVKIDDDETELFSENQPSSSNATAAALDQHNYHQTSDPLLEEFRLRYVHCKGNNSLIIVSRRATKQIIDGCTRAFVDIQSKSAPSIATQVLQIYCETTRNPALYAASVLMTARTCEAYVEAFETLIDICQNEGSCFEPSVVVCDYDEVLRKALNEVLNRISTKTVLRGSYPGFCEDLRRHARNLKLLFASEPSRTTYAMLKALPLMPKESIPGLFEGIGSSVPGDSKVSELVRYFDSYWMETIGPESFSVFNESDLLTNEVFKSLSRNWTFEKSRRCKPSIWQFLTILRVEEGNAAEAASAILEGVERSTPVRELSVEELMIRQQWERLDDPGDQELVEDVFRQLH